MNSYRIPETRLPPLFEMIPMEAPQILESFRLEIECGLKPWTMEDYLQILEERDLWLALVARTKENTSPTIIGTGLARYLGREMELCKIAIQQNFRRYHIGTALLEFLLEEGRRRHCEICFLEVRISNLEAFRFYEQRDFRILGKRPDYYTDPSEDALIMGCDLQTPGSKDLEKSKGSA